MPTITTLTIQLQSLNLKENKIKLKEKHLIKITIIGFTNTVNPLHVDNHHPNNSTPNPESKKTKNKN